MILSLLVITAAAASFHAVAAFGVPPTVKIIIMSPPTTSSWINPIPFEPQSSSVMLSPTTHLSSSSSSSSSLSSLFLLADDGVNAMFDVLRNVAVGLTAIVFLLAGLAYVTASIIIPAAAQELERECLELDPELWRDYLAQLEPGQTMAQRPDLMQELGIKLQPLLDAKIARMDAGEEEVEVVATLSTTATAEAAASPPQPTATIVDVVEVEEPSSFETEVVVVEQEPTITLSTMGSQWDDNDPQAETSNDDDDKTP